MEVLVRSASGTRPAAWLREPSAPTRSRSASSWLGAVGVGEDHRRPVAVTSMTVVSRDAEPDVAAVAAPRVGEVDEDVGLRVEPDRCPDQVLEVDPVACAAEAQLDPVVLVAVAQHPVGDPGVDEQPDAVALQDAGPVGLLDLVGGCGSR